VGHWAVTIDIEGRELSGDISGRDGKLLNAPPARHKGIPDEGHKSNGTWRRGMC
jgi:hypothetical protein